MSRFYFKVWIDVEDDAGGSTECYDPDYFNDCEEVEDEDGNIVTRFLSPEKKAQIIMGARLGVEEDMGPAIGSYQVDWKEVEG